MTHVSECSSAKTAARLATSHLSRFSSLKKRGHFRDNTTFVHPSCTHLSFLPHTGLWNLENRGLCLVLRSNAEMMNDAKHRLMEQRLQNLLQYVTTKAYARSASPDRGWKLDQLDVLIFWLHCTLGISPCIFKMQEAYQRLSAAQKSLSWNFLKGDPRCANWVPQGCCDIAWYWDY